MKKKKIIILQNYLERIPSRPESIRWTIDENAIVTLEIENKGWGNRLAQTLFGRPKISYIHLDAMGSFIWPEIDGNKNIMVIGELVEQQFGDNAKPLYERLARYFQILDSYHFIEWK